LILPSALAAKRLSDALIPGATTWTGPGINGSITANIAGLPADFWLQWADNAELYPQGIDVIFTCGERLVGLPRTIKVEA
jgi:alpha-D-ribose 1-methylphosphonate 5-triphosphate synthase subunit PhnH